jgi:GTPase involved in cell partitioning and DNA repair
MFAVLCHEALVADVGEEEAFVDDDVGGILVGGVDGALIGVPFLTHVGIAVLLLVVLLLLLPPLVALSLSLDIGHFAIK